MVRALVEKGPVAVAVAAGSAWKFYLMGIMQPGGCDEKILFSKKTRKGKINHSVVLFGYGEQEKKDTDVKQRYWHIKNSWGRFWGEKGNLRLQRHDKEGDFCTPLE